MTMKKDLDELRRQCYQQLDGKGLCEVMADDDPGRCDICGKAMGVQKTISNRRVATLEYGRFEVRETVHVCPDGCRYPSGRLVTARSSTLSNLLIPRRAVGYDVMAFIGRQRFEEHRQREEIQDILSAEPYS